MDQKSAINEIEVLEKDYRNVNRVKMRAYLLKKGLPIEVVTRLDDLWDATKKIGGKVIEVGKVIFCRIMQFIGTYPKTAIGILVGAAIGSLASAVPLLGSLLAPITTALGAVMGGLAGAKMDTGKNELECVMQIAQDFFKMIIDIFSALFGKSENLESA